MSKSSVWKATQGFIVLVALLNLASCFNMKAFCEKECKLGRGGNLCQCNAVHFAGKRNNGLSPGIAANTRDEERDRLIGEIVQEVLKNLLLEIDLDAVTGQAGANLRAATRNEAERRNGRYERYVLYKDYVARDQNS